VQAGTQIQKAVVRSIMHLVRRALAAAGATRLTPVLVARPGTTQRRTRPTPSGRASAVTTCNLTKAAKAAGNE